MAARRRRVKDAAPYRVASFGIHRTTEERPDQARPKRVTRVALWFNRTVATGGRAAMRQRSPRAGTFPPSPRTKLPRKRGPGGGRLRAPLGARRSRPPAILWWLSDRSESHSPPGRRNPPNQTARCKTGRRGQRAPYESKRAVQVGQYVIARRAAGPTRQSASPVQERRIPTAPPGPRNDGEGTHCAPAGDHTGPPLRDPLKCNVERRRGQAPAVVLHCMGSARRGLGPGRPLLALWANSPSRAPRKRSLLPILPGARKAPLRMPRPTDTP